MKTSTLKKKKSQIFTNSYSIYSFKTKHSLDNIYAINLYLYKCIYLQKVSISTYCVFCSSTYKIAEE